jgi:mRNA interferase HigB
MMGAYYDCPMRIISVGTLKAFWERPTYRDAEQPLHAWVKVVRAARWTDPPAVKRMFNIADILRDGRIVFDISGNRYRLVAWVNYHYGVVYVRFIRTHRSYDRIDAQTI